MARQEIKTKRVKKGKNYIELQRNVKLRNAHEGNEEHQELNKY